MEDFQDGRSHTHKFPRNRMFLLSRIEIERCRRREVFPRGSGVSSFQGCRRSRMNGLEIFERRSAAVELRQWNIRLEPFFHRTSANRVSNFDRRRATWPWLFVFGDFPAFSKGGSLDFSRPNPLPTIVRTHWIGERGVFRGIHWIHWIDMNPLWDAKIS